MNTSGNIVTAQVDLSGFNRIFDALAQVVPQDARDFVRDETARLAEECANQLSRRSGIQKGQIIKDIRSVFAPMPKNPIPEAHRHGSKMKWIQAGPNYLVGVKPLRYHVDDSVADMQRLFYKSKGTLPANRRTELGVHGRSRRWDFKTGAAYGQQHAYEFNRLVVRRGVFRDFVNAIKKRIGRLEASFALTAKILRGNNARVKAYIGRHLNGEPLRNITELANLSNTEAPSVTFGSTAPGVESFIESINTAINIRVGKMRDRFDLIVSGYSKDVQRRISPRRHANEVGVIE